MGKDEVPEEEFLEAQSKFKEVKKEKARLQKLVADAERAERDLKEDEAKFPEYPKEGGKESKYDAKLTIPSLTALKDGLPLRFGSGESPKTVEGLEGQCYAVIGPLGTGKTWMVNQISHGNLKSGKHTTGVCLYSKSTKVDEKKMRFLAFDSPGHGAPVCNTNVRDQATADAFQLDLTIALGANLVVVVNNWGYYEQAFVENVINRARVVSSLPTALYLERRVFVLHNQTSISTEDEIRAYEEFLAKAHSTEEVKLSLESTGERDDHRGRYHLNFLRTHGGTVRHCVLGHQKSSSGRRQNTYVFNQMREWFARSNVSRVNFTELLLSNVNALLPRFIKTKTKVDMLEDDGKYILQAMDTERKGQPVDRIFEAGILRPPQKDERGRSTGYDCVVDMDSIKALETRGWTIEISNPDIEKQLRSQRAIVLSILGMYKVGKTWVLNQIARTGLRDDQVMHTKGISMKVPKREEGNIVILDTAGTNVPVRQERMQDLKATEDLLQDVIFTLADYVLIVVNRLTYSDQIYIRGVIGKLQSAAEWKLSMADESRPWASMMSGGSTKLFVVHNWSNISTIAEMEAVKKEEFHDAYQLEEGEAPVTLNSGKEVRAKYFRVKEGLVEISHVFLARQGTEAGDSVNEITIALLFDSIAKEQQQRQFDVFKSLAGIVNENLPKYVLDDIQVEVVKEEGDWRVQLKEEYQGKEVRLRDTIYAGAGGHYIAPHQTAYVPHFDAFEVKEKGKYRVEIPIPCLLERGGYYKVRVEPEETTTFLVVEGENPAPVPSDVEKRHYFRTNMQYGAFRLRWPSPKIVDDTEEGIEHSYDDGVIVINLTIDEDEDEEPPEGYPGSESSSDESEDSEDSEDSEKESEDSSGSGSDSE